MDQPQVIDLSKYIETELYGERPHVRGRRIPIAVIADNAHDNKWDVEELAYQFTLTIPEVLAALLYYEEHKELIEQQEAVEQALKDEMYRLYGAKD